ncbi:uncharacterized protein LOC126323729 [Schistocerca gregaria]|uniref:uncharacterized protein LOC126323729 n=1 Tax=Schistocerca gregaria TaxID=7010 RepID=UPI00211E872C|nr:uncharacterized protein LOC126323729 [Schistocerca gregaria]
MSSLGKKRRAKRGRPPRTAPKNLSSPSGEGKTTTRTPKKKIDENSISKLFSWRKEMPIDAMSTPSKTKKDLKAKDDADSSTQVECVEPPQTHRQEDASFLTPVKKKSRTTSPSDLSEKGSESASSEAEGSPAGHSRFPTQGSCPFLNCSEWLEVEFMPQPKKRKRYETAPSAPASRAGFMSAGRVNNRSTFLRRRGLRGSWTSFSASLSSRLPWEALSSPLKLVTGGLQQLKKRTESKDNSNETPETVTRAAVGESETPSSGQKTVEPPRDSQSQVGDDALEEAKSEVQRDTSNLEDTPDKPYDVEYQIQKIEDAYKSRNASVPQEPKSNRQTINSPIKKEPVILPPNNPSNPIHSAPIYDYNLMSQRAPSSFFSGGTSQYSSVPPQPSYPYSSSFFQPIQNNPSSFPTTDSTPFFSSSSTSFQRPASSSSAYHHSFYLPTPKPTFEPSKHWNQATFDNKHTYQYRPSSYDPFFPTSERVPARSPMTWSSIKSGCRLLLVCLLVVFSFGFAALWYFKLQSPFPSNQNLDQVYSIVKDKLVQYLRVRRGAFLCGEALNDWASQVDLETLCSNLLPGYKRYRKGIDLLWKKLRYDSNVRYDQSLDHYSYVGNQPILSLKCTLKRWVLKLLFDNALIIVVVLNLLAVLLLSRAYVSRKRRNRLLVEELKEKIISRLRKKKNSSTQYIPVSHLKVELADSTSQKIWDTVVQDIQVDPRIQVTPRLVSGEQMLTWAWISDL